MKTFLIYVAISIVLFLYVLGNIVGTTDIYRCKGTGTLTITEKFVPYVYEKTPSYVIEHTHFNRVEKIIIWLFSSAINLEFKPFDYAEVRLYEITQGYKGLASFWILKTDTDNSVTHIYKAPEGIVASYRFFSEEDTRREHLSFNRYGFSYYSSFNYFERETLSVLKINGSCNKENT